MTCMTTESPSIIHSADIGAGKHCKPDGISAEKERTGISHEYLCGVEIEYEKRGKRTADSRGKYCHFRTAAVNAEYKERNADNKRNAPGKTVDPIREVRAVCYICHREQHYDIIEHSAAEHAAPGKGDIRIAIAVSDREPQVERARKELQNKLLTCRKPFIALFEQLDIIIHEPDKPVQKSKTENERKWCCRARHPYRRRMRRLSRQAQPA